MNERALPGADGLDLTDRLNFRIWTREVLRFADTDAVGHINNGAYAACFETARIKMLMAMSEETRAGTHLTWVLARLCIDFIDQLFYPGEVEVGTRILRMGRSSMSVAQGLFAADKCCGAASAVLVMIDGDSGRPCAIPERLRDHIAGLVEA